MSQREILVRNGALAACALFALLLLVSFYSTVNGAVERAASHRSAPSDARPVSSVAGSIGMAARPSTLLARSDS